MQPDGTPNRLDGLPETEQIQSLLAGMGGPTPPLQTPIREEHQQTSRENGMMAKPFAFDSIMEFFSRVNWKNLKSEIDATEIQISPTKSAISTTAQIFQMGLGEFLGSVNWKNTTDTTTGNDNEILEDASRFSIESVLGGIAWD
ncbi:MAG: hypothetical protein ACFCD0_27145 [Gemmataceae bacterium]